jgi:hypothetical protein
MIQRIIIALIAALSACETTPQPTIAVCDPAMREWILQCIEKANPHSDEEPEDNTAQCEYTAARLFCGPSCFVSLSGVILCHSSESLGQ